MCFRPTHYGQRVVFDHKGKTATILAGNGSFVITGVETTSCGRRLVTWSRDALFGCSRSRLQEEMVKQRFPFHQIG